MILNNKTQADLLTEIIDQCRDGVVLVDREKPTYATGTF